MARVAAATAAPPDQARSPGLGFKTQRVRADTFEPAEDEPEMFWLLDEIVTKSAKLNGTQPTGDIVAILHKKRFLSGPYAFGQILSHYLSSRTGRGFTDDDYDDTLSRGLCRSRVDLSKLESSNETAPADLRNSGSLTDFIT